MKKTLCPPISAIAILLCMLALRAVVFAGDPPRPAEPSGKKETTTPAVAHSYDADAMRVQGEQRFRANCGRCHAAPQKFPPRMMATVLRHMRVRATITDQDMRLVLFYMSQ
jgi:mono/diheme cytochrome c family protein